MKRGITGLLIWLSVWPKPSIAVASAGASLVIVTVAPYPIDPFAVVASGITAGFVISKNYSYVKGFSAVAIAVCSVVLASGLAPYIADKISNYAGDEPNGFLRLLVSVVLTCWLPILQWTKKTVRIWAAHHG